VKYTYGGDATWTGKSTSMTTVGSTSTPRAGHYRLVQRCDVNYGTGKIQTSTHSGIIELERSEFRDRHFIPPRLLPMHPAELGRWSLSLSRIRNQRSSHWGDRRKTEILIDSVFSTTRGVRSSKRGSRNQLAMRNLVSEVWTHHSAGSLAAARAGSRLSPPAAPSRRPT
jgi:hypothetical protein